jgi:type III pantothenate kinase
MTERLVADVGNSRIKWGLVRPDGITVAALVADDSAGWQRLLREWGIGRDTDWAIAGVHPERRDALGDWLRQSGANVRVIDDYRELPLHVDVAVPEKVGIDRLLNGVGALARGPRGKPIVIIDAGTAVTVDLVDESRKFRGGAIFPGLDLMAKSLHQNTARLPYVDGFDPHDMPGRNTEAAIRAGVFHAICGGIDRLVDEMRLANPVVLLAGGSTEIAAGIRCRPEVVGTALTLEGLRRTAWPDT